jgi:hypothetical protein
VGSGVSTVDDESQLEASAEKDELMDELEEKDEAAEWLFDPYRRF